MDIGLHGIILKMPVFIKLQADSRETAAPVGHAVPDVFFASACWARRAQPTCYLRILIPDIAIYAIDRHLTDKGLQAFYLLLFPAFGDPCLLLSRISASPTIARAKLEGSGTGNGTSVCHTCHDRFAKLIP